MGWISKAHQCRRPALTVLGVRIRTEGSIWECPSCKRRWRVGVTGAFPYWVKHHKPTSGAFPMAC